MAASPAGSMVAMKNILVATDFSSSSQMALDYAAMLARQQQGKILLAHVIYGGPVFPFEEAPPEGLPDVGSARRQMEAVMAAPKFATLDYELLLPHGDICSVLEEIVAGRRIDLLVLGTHGREGVLRLLVGSVAENVLRCTRCPVLIVGPLVKAGPLRPKLERILVATDFTPACDQALRLARQLAQAEKASLAVVHVMDVSQTGGDAALPARKEEAHAKLRAAAPDAVEITLESGEPADAIVRLAREQQASLIVMGLHRRSAFWSARFGWTTAHQVISHAPCPVLTAKCLEPS